ncbi:MAG: hypothetical protein B7Y89_17770 [Novosphingobium sp. 32-60-15]|uniref:DUF6118 family protein n=1 Tax=Novosphingobium sp. 32-60-15 TaxID=1970410 RepID=UPI000BD4F468|nr:DUF6118 family protein [Novosphingobium sp. 32-60-15]OYX59716.1 MAG: hypothetical protein B7Y89_17770 [Novosphingobium sp. 32-60-15]
MAEDEDLGADPAAAFEALRAEVAGLRAGLERGRDGPATPDYAPTLGKIAATLAAIEAHPALALTPEVFAYQVRQAREAAQQQGGRDLATAVQRLAAAGAELERLAERQRIGREQVRQVAIMTAMGAVAGVIVWVAFSGPIARALPASWRVPERMAAATLRLDRWDAGAQLMRTADPTSWNGLAAASSLWRANADVLEGCARSAARTGKAQRCAVTLGPPPAPKPGQAKD